MANNPQSSSAQPHWPPAVGSLGPQNYGSPLSSQFRPLVPPQQGQHFVPAASQQFRPVGQVPSSNVGLPAVQNQQMQFSQPMQQFPPRPNQPGLSTPSAQSLPYGQTNRPLTSASPQPHQTGPPLNGHMPGLGAPGMPPSSSYSFTPASFSQLPNNVSMSSQFQPISQVHAPVAPVAGQPWLSSGNQSVSIATPMQQTGQQPPLTSSADMAANVPSLTSQSSSSSDWQEHTSADGRRYYYNKKTRQSSWEKPLELMTPIERADASTVWKEFTTPEGRKYYYNKVTKQSKWTIPEELKLAREQAQVAASQGTPSDTAAASQAPDTGAVPSSEATTAAVSVSSNTLPASSPVSVTPVAAANPSPNLVSGSTVIPVPQTAPVSTSGVQHPAVALTPLPAVSSGVSTAPVTLGNSNTTLMSSENTASQETAHFTDGGASSQDIEEAKKGMATAGKVNVTAVEEKSPDDEPLTYANKQEAKNAFKSLLESAKVQSDWTWEQTMREIINDKRYGALKTLGERKQAFNEYLGQRKKLEAEERRMRQKKAREEFTKMLEESKELTSSMRWSKAQSLFENDERFKAVERVRDREDLFENYIVELERKERENAAEEKRQNIAEYKKFLESCDFIKASTQWRKVQDRLEDDERCSRLEKIDRLLIFGDYITELEKEEEEKKKIQKEQLRRAERKNRDAFRKLMEEHVTDGTLKAKTSWRNYCLTVKDLPQYLAVASNTSGSTPKDLFEDVAEELEKQYYEDKMHIKDAMKSGKITMVSTWTFEDFKAAISEDVGSLPMSDMNLKLVYEELLERAKEKEEKEARKRQRLADDFTELLKSYKEITASSNWEDSISLFEESQEYRAITEESFRREIFEEYIAHLQEKAKEKERKREEEKAKKEKEREEKEKRKEKEKEKDRKEKEKDRKEKEREREKEKVKERTKKDETDSENLDISENHSHKDDKKKEKEKDRKHRKRHQSAADDGSSDKDDREESKKSRRHDRKKSRKHAHSPDSESESRHKKHKRDHSRRNGGYEELEDGEVGEDGEIE